MGSRILEKNLEELTQKAFVLLKVSPDVEFTRFYSRLLSLKDIKFCNAVRGDIDIILDFQSETDKEIQNIYEDSILKLKEIQSSVLLTLCNPQRNSFKKSFLSSGYESLPDLNDPKKVYSYILIRSEEQEINNVLQLADFNENVLLCSKLSGVFNIIMLVSGASFSEIDKFIEKKLMNVEGILKIKEYPVINIFNL